MPDTQEGIRDRFGAVFFITINSSMAGLIGTIIVFPEQRLIFEKERNAGMYGTTTYVLAKSVPNFLEQCVFSALYILIAYWAVGLNSSFGEVYLIITLCILASGSIGMIVGCFANNTSEVLSICCLCLYFFFMFCLCLCLCFKILGNASNASFFHSNVTFHQLYGFIGSNSRVDSMASIFGCV